jgi:hypothetical protein
MYRAFLGVAVIAHDEFAAALSLLWRNVRSFPTVMLCEVHGYITRLGKWSYSVPKLKKLNSMD